MVARMTGGHEAAGSSPVTRTKSTVLRDQSPCFYFLLKEEKSMKTRGIILFLVISMLLVCVAGCGKKADSEVASDVENPISSQDASMSEEDGQNPVMNIIGSYMDRVGQRASMDIVCEGTDSGRVVISWAGSAFEQAVWEFSGKWDEDTHSIQYSNCKKAIRSYDDSGTMTETVEYENGTGAIIVQDDYTITWKDDQENAGQNCVFEFSAIDEDAAEG